MSQSLNTFLEQVARRGSRFGGGSVAALSAALSAALLEKLVTQPQTGQRLRRIRRECLRLVDRDAAAFARVVASSRSGNQVRFRRALKDAIEIPMRVIAYAQAVRAAGRIARRSIAPRFQSDLRCAMALTDAAATSARALINANLAWLGDRRYAAVLRHRLRRLA